ncbi:MAG: four-carbon acid sugar kinase family protein [Amaricoccus sp.]
MDVLIIADDLTGALDSAVTLTGAGLRCVVARRPGDIAAALALRPDVLGVSTASREGSVEAARAAVAAAVDAVGALPGIVFKKVDSRLKGHVAGEVATLAERSGRGRALVAPAIPVQGRVVAGGRLAGTGVAVPIDVAAALAGSGLALDVPDAATDADLDGALARALEGPAPLLVGAAGLAAALARRLAHGPWAVPAPRLAAPILFAIGSHDPITLAQVDRLAASGMASVNEAPDGACPPSVGGNRVVRLVAGGGGAFDPGRAGARFADGIAQVVRAGGVGTLFGCGGETADAILGALGAGVLAVDGEVLPGVPASRILLAGRPLQVVTKSGGFGGEDAMVAVVAAAEPREGGR